MPRPRKLRKSAQISGEWVRATQYSLIYTTPPAIFPDERVTFHSYDPWTPFRRNEGARMKEPQPYLKLLNLGKQVRESPDRTSDLVLSWCNANGLLGILPAFVDSLWFPPVIDECDSPHENVFDGDGGWFRALQLRYLRSGGVWRSQLLDGHWTEDKDTATQEGEEFDTPVVQSRYQWNRATYVNRSVSERFFPIIGTLEAKLVRSKTRNDTSPVALSMFREEFVDPRGNRPRELVFAPSIPLPGTREFFKVYGERIHDIVDWARRFESEVRNLHSTSGRAQGALEFLADIATAANPTFRLVKLGHYEEVRVSAGLLSSFALMMLWDLEAGRLIRECKNCGTYFVSKDARAGYCCVTCRLTSQSRRYRARKRMVAAQDQ